jgi:hypothetical protein
VTFFFVYRKTSPPIPTCVVSVGLNLVKDFVSLGKITSRWVQDRLAYNLGVSRVRIQARQPPSNFDQYFYLDTFAFDVNS